MSKTFTNTGAVAMQIGDTSIAAAGTDVISDEEADALGIWYPATSFAANLIDPETDHYDALTYPAGLSSAEVG